MINCMPLEFEKLNWPKEIMKSTCHANYILVAKRKKKKSNLLHPASAFNHHYIWHEDERYANMQYLYELVW